MKKFFKEAWKRIVFILGVTLVWLIASFITIFGGAGKGLEVIAEVFKTEENE